MKSRVFRRVTGLMLVGLALLTSQSLGQFRAGVQFGRSDCPSGECPTAPAIQATVEPDETLALSQARVFWPIVRLSAPLGGGVQGVGSGSVIYSGNGEALILTCSHLFDPEGPGQSPTTVVVDLFGAKVTADPPRLVAKLRGELVKRNRDRDVAIVRIRPAIGLYVSPLAPRGWRPRPGEPLVSSGFPHAGKMRSFSSTFARNTTVNSRGTGQPSPVYETSGRSPAQGESGGPLMNSDQQIVGVCDFADARSRTGLYASTASIYELLDECKLTSLVTSKDGPVLASNTPRIAPPTAVISSLPEPELVELDLDPTAFEAIDPQTGQHKVMTQADYQKAVQEEAARLNRESATKGTPPPLAPDTGTGFHWTHGVGLASGALLVIGAILAALLFPKAMMAAAENAPYMIKDERWAELTEERVERRKKTKAAPDKWAKLEAAMGGGSADPKP